MDASDKAMLKTRVELFCEWVVAIHVVRVDAQDVSLLTRVASA